MGLRYRGRTKGKNAWINWSWSDNHGLGASVSYKAGPFTWNSGNGKTTKKRVTTNLPGGFYHVSTDKSPRRNRPTQSIEQWQASQEAKSGPGTLTIFFAVWIIATVLYNWPWVAIVAAVLWFLVWFGEREEKKEKEAKNRETSDSET